MKKILLGLFLILSLTAKADILLEECYRWVEKEFTFTKLELWKKVPGVKMCSNQWIHSCKYTDTKNTWWQQRCYHINPDGGYFLSTVMVSESEFNDKILPNTLDKRYIYEHNRLISEDVSIEEKFVLKKGKIYKFSKYKIYPDTYQDSVYEIDSHIVLENAFYNAYNKSTECE